MAPEIFKNEPYKLGSDIWSLGVLLYLMAVGKLPFKDTDSQGTMNKILFSNPIYPPTMTQSLQDLLNRMMTKNPNERISCDDISTHPWFSPREYTYTMIITEQWKDFDINLSVIPKMEQMGISIDNIRQNITLKVFNESIAIYRILCRNDYIEKLQRIPRSQTFKPIHGRARSDTCNRLKQIQGSASTNGINKLKDSTPPPDEIPRSIGFQKLPISTPPAEEKKKYTFRPRSRSRSTKTALMLTEAFD